MPSRANHQKGKVGSRKGDSRNPIRNLISRSCFDRRIHHCGIDLLLHNRTDNRGKNGGMCHSARISGLLNGSIDPDMPMRRKSMMDKKEEWEVEPTDSDAGILDHAEKIYRSSSRKKKNLIYLDISKEEEEFYEK
jgi:hypothetical protein